MRDGIALLQLGDIGDPEVVHPNLEAVGDGVFELALFTPLDELAADPHGVYAFLTDLLGPYLRQHPDPRGVFVFPDLPHPDAYEAVVDTFDGDGFWALEAPLDPPDEPAEPRLPAHEEVERLRNKAIEVIASRMGAGRLPGPPTPDPRPVRTQPTDDGPLQQSAERYAALSDACARAAAHLRRTAEHFEAGDVPRASAHRVAAEGHLVTVREGLDALAVVHAAHAEP